MKVITTPQCNRPQYTSQMLNSLAACKNIYNYGLVACVEPGNDQVIELLNAFTATRAKTIIINDRKLGCNTNTMKTMFKGFEQADTILHVEDDVILAEDALVKYEDWAESKDNSFSFCLYNKIARESYKPFKFDDILERRDFIPWGFGIRKDKYLTALEAECFSMRGEYLSWDCRIKQLCLSRGMRHKYTFLSRSNNIGAEGGVHVPSKEWHTNNQLLTFWAGNLNETEIH